MPEPERYAQQVKCCYYCGSVNCRFAYLNNGKADQPRYRCHDCREFFTFGSQHRRRRGTKHGKKRGIDPDDVRDLPRQCPFCGEAKDTRFKYYNNKSQSGSKSQPRFQCLSCRKPFQMRLITNGTESHLVPSRTSTSNITQSIKPAKITKGSAQLKLDHVQASLPNVDNIPLPASMVPENGMPDSMEVGNGDLLDVDIFDGALAEMCFNDQARMNWFPDENMFNDDQMDLSDFALPSSLPEKIIESPFCAAEEPSSYRLWDVEAALMTDDIEDDMVVSNSEAYHRIVEELPALNSQGSLEVPEADQRLISFASQLEEALVEGGSFASELQEALPEDDTFASELEEALLDSDDTTFASELEETLLEEAEAAVTSEQNYAACRREWKRQCERAARITWLPPTSEPTTLALRAALNDI